MAKWSRPLLACATAFALLGSPLLIGWILGEFHVFWTEPGAALIQSYGSSIACLWGARLLRSEPRKKP